MHHRTTDRETRWHHTFQLRHLITGAVHPLAPSPASLVHTLEEGAGPVSFSFHISGNNLGVLFISPSEGNGESELVIWDWKTGHVRMVSRNAWTGSFSFSDFAYVEFVWRRIWRANTVLCISYRSTYLGSGT